MERDCLPLAANQLVTETATARQAKQNPKGTRNDDELTKKLHKSHSTVRAAKCLLGKENF